MTPDTYSPAQIADRLSNDGHRMAEDRVRKIVRQECAALVPDELRMVPGGRVDDNVLVIFAGVFDSVVSGRAVTRTAPVPTMIHSIDTRKAAS